MKSELDCMTSKRAGATHSSPNKVASRPRGKFKRKAIIDAAASILMEKGYDGLVMRDVAARAETLLGNLHYYFPTKQALLLAIFDEESSAYAVTLREEIGAASTRDKKLIAIIDSSLAEFTKPQLKLWRILVALAQHDTEALRVLRRENDLFHKAVATELRKIEPRLTAQKASRIARIIWAMLDGFAIQITHELDTKAEIEALKAEARAAILAIVAHP